MRLYAMHGRRAEAVHQYETCAATLARELGVEPEVQTKRLHGNIRHEVASSGISPRRSTVALQQPPIVGREAELSRLDQALDEAWADSGRLVVLSGDAGVGKSRLLEAVASRAVERGGLTMRGRCFESEQVLPFALWVDLLRSEPSWTDEALRRMPSTLRAEVSRILPSRGDGADPSARSPNDARPLFDAVSELLTRLAEQAPLLVVLEDLHWADAMSLRLLSFLARRRSPVSRVCLMATVRAEEISGSTLLRTVLQEVDREQLLRGMSVLPLPREDTLALLRTLEPLPAGMAGAGARWSSWIIQH